MKIFILCIIVIFYAVVVPEYSFARTPQQVTEKKFWEYQCIDTMKLSRDSARALSKEQDFVARVDFQIYTIKELGANCVSLGTPYDEEFLPYLRFWVTKAHKAGLHVWFRGNFSGWEGWFDYPRAITPDQHIAMTRKFILSNPDLFADGDIFSPSVEAENGWPGGEPAGKNKNEYRRFLQAQYQSTQQAFNHMNKQVIVNWYSMSGGVAKSVLDSRTIESLGSVVTLDHYVDSVEKMTDYITKFRDRGATKIVLGEFGAPIPNLNGKMTEDEQAIFVEKLLIELYKNRTFIQGVNYWTFTHSSTALYNDDDTPRKVASVIRAFYDPTQITGKITDGFGEPIANATIITDDHIQTVKTSMQGSFSLLLPARPVTISISHPDYQDTFTVFKPLPGERINSSIKLTPKDAPFWYHLYTFWKGLWKRPYF